MKKLVCILLSILMLTSVTAFVGCEKAPDAEPALKLGLGVYTSTPTTSDATEDKDGQGSVAVTAAVITVDADGKVVACQLDTADLAVKFTLDGKAVANDGFKTKREKGAAYGMTAAGAAKEWFEQADAFETFIVGKTLDEIKALVAEGNKGNSDVVAAGCTIMIHEFVGAIEKAFANLADSAATASSALKLGIHVEQTTSDATEDKEGSNQVETTVFAASVDAEGKVLVAASDCVQVKFTFNATGASTLDTTKAITSKREAGADYGMSQWGTDLNGDGVIKEWFEQADAFNALCVGKTASEIKALCAADNYGTDEVKTAGCTILVNGLTKAAAKLG